MLCDEDNGTGGIDAVIALILKHPDTHKVPDLGRCFEHLARRAALHGYLIELNQDPDASFEGSSHDKFRKTVYLATHPGSGSRRTVSDLVCSLAHEIGHIEDPERAWDASLIHNSRGWWVRKLEREAEAWRLARAILDKETCWAQIKAVFATAESSALKKYREQSESVLASIT